MPNLLNTSSVLMCPHGGTVSAVSSNAQAKAGGDFIVRLSDTFTIAGCPFNISGAPSPCTQVQWVVGATQTKAAGDFALTESSVGLCIGPTGPAGPVMINSTQPEVSGL